jgi:caffeoyl-CoA O-methyltransferase
VLRLALLVKLIGARRALEIGTFTGYSALVVALAMPDDGRVIACNIDADFTAIARRYWQAAGIAYKIELKLAPALDTIGRLLADGAAGTFDMAFIDADKRTTPPTTSTACRS